MEGFGGNYGEDRALPPSEDRAVAATPSSPAVSPVPASIPSASGLRFCRDCVHLERALCGGSLIGGPRCLHPKSYEGGDFDLVTGRDGRRFRAAEFMRSAIGKCGKSAKLFQRPERRHFAPNANPLNSGDHHD